MSERDLFRPVSVDRLSQVIVVQIKTLIRDGAVNPGDRLPSERDLSQRFGVSRVAVREALRVLEASGLVKIRVGAHGGAFVSTPSTEMLGEGLARFLAVTSLEASSVTEARMVIELGTLPLVVERATEDDVRDLLALAAEGKEALESGTYTMAMSAAFHVRLARCTHNPAIETLVQSFHGPLLMSLREAKVAAPLMGPRGNAEHRALAEAISARDLVRAEELMRRHLNRTARRVSRPKPRRPDQTEDERTPEPG